MSEDISPFVFDPTILDEIAFHLYKHPKSAIRELISNGLDQQKGQKHPRIEILTHVPPDNDIWIEDWGTGIEDMKNFEVIGRGKKEVMGSISTTEIIDPDIAGHKGFGKVAARALSGSQPEPIVEWWSHRPQTDRYHAQGVKVTLLKSKGGYTREWMNDIAALSHPGVKCVIKNVIYEKLPPNIVHDISKWFAIRISRGAQIFFNGNQISKPEGFDSDVGKEPLFIIDGIPVYGNIKYRVDPEGKNIWICVKNIYVDAESFDNPCEGWINDNYLTPTTSREAIESNERYKKVKEALQQYLDEHYPKPAIPSIGKMGRAKEKTDLLIKALKQRKKFLKGKYNIHGIPGHVTDTKGTKLNWIELANITLTQEGGAENGPPIIPISDKKKKKKKKVRHRGGKGPHPSIEEGTGDHHVITPEGEPPENPEQDRIEPEMTENILDLGKNRPMMTMTESEFTFNSYWPQSVRAHEATGMDWQYVVAPVYAQALLNMDIQEGEVQITDTESWQRHYASYMKWFIEN